MPIYRPVETCGVNFFIPKPDSDSEKIFSHDSGSDSENFRFAASDFNPDSENFYFLTPTPTPENSEKLRNFIIETGDL